MIVYCISLFLLMGLSNLLLLQMVVACCKILFLFGVQSHMTHCMYSKMSTFPIGHLFHEDGKCFNRKLFDCRDSWLDFQSTKKYQLRFIGGKSRNRVKSRNPWFYYIPWLPPMYLDWSQNLPWHPNSSGLCTRKISIGKIPHPWDKNASRTNLDPSKFLSRLWTRRVISPMAAAKRPFS